MEVVHTTLAKAEIKRVGDDYLLILSFDHGRMRKPYLPRKWSWPLDDINNIFKVMEITNAKEWQQCNNKTVRLKCEFEKLDSVGHPINDVWLDA